MSFLDDELSLDEILSMQAEVEPKSERKPRTKKDPFEDRSIENWFRLDKDHVRNCEVPEHNEERPRNKGMTVIINDVAVCRLCFLNRVDSE